jgi:hypothetical protein
MSHTDFPDFIITCDHTNLASQVHNDLTNQNGMRGRHVIIFHFWSSRTIEVVAHLSKTCHHAKLHIPTWNACLIHLRSTHDHHAGIRGCIQKFPDWPPGARTAMAEISASRCSCVAILSVSLVSVAAITHVASQRVIPKVRYISLSTQSENFLIHPRTWWQGDNKFHCPPVLMPCVWSSRNSAR